MRKDEEQLPLSKAAQYLLEESRMILPVFSMFPLAIGITVDFYLIARVILQNERLSTILAGGLLAVFVVLWFILPHLLERAIKHSIRTEHRSNMSR